MDQGEYQEAVPIISWYIAQFLMEADKELVKPSGITVQRLYQNVCDSHQIQNGFPEGLPLFNFGVAMMLAYGIFVFPKEILGNSVDWSQCQFKPGDSFNFLVDEMGAENDFGQFIRGMRNSISHANVKYLGGFPVDRKDCCTFWSETNGTKVVNFKVQVSEKGFLKFLDTVAKFMINEVLLPQKRKAASL